MSRDFLLLVAVLAGAAACDGSRAYVGSSSLHHAKHVDDGDDEDNSSAETTSDEAEPLPEAETVDAGPPPPAPFTGASSFASLAPETDSSRHHLKTTNAGKDCMSCHAAGEGAPTFAFAGTLYRTKDAAEGATGAEVRIVDAKGAEVALVNTDSAGNFWLLSSTLKIPAGARVGVRDGTSTKTMNGAISTGGCNQTSCHNSARRMFLGAP